MLRQNINLYPAFQPAPVAEEAFSWRTFCRAQIIFAICVLLFFFALMWQLYHLKSAQSQKQALINQLQEKLLVKKNYYPLGLFQQSAAEKTHQINALQQPALQNIFNNTLISRSLVALSNVAVPDVWLNSIVIDDGGNEITLKGMSQDANHLQNYLKQLLEGVDFKAYLPNLKNIQAVQENTDTNEYSFEIHLTKKTV